MYKKILFCLLIAIVASNIGNASAVTDDDFELKWLIKNKYHSHNL